MLLRAGILFTIMVFANYNLIAEDIFELNSPDNKLRINISVDNDIKWSVILNSIQIISPSNLSMNIDGKLIPGKHPTLVSSETNYINRNYYPIVPIKSKVVNDECNEIILYFESNCSVIFRAYNNGCAYRFILGIEDSIRVIDEELLLNFPDEYYIYFPQESSFISHFEQNYSYKKIKTISQSEFCSLPALVDTRQGVKIGLTESSLYDYPGLFLSGTSGNSLKGIFPKAILEASSAEIGADRNEVIKKEADYIAATTGKRSFPWRIFMISHIDAELLENQLVYLLSDELKLEDTDWIKPGKVAWDWWNALNIYGVDFKSGPNTETYQYYIDFASEYGIEYIILDEGWSKSGEEIMEPNPEIDVVELINYGKTKNVGVILWVLWKPLYNNLEKALDLYASWGAAGVKVDFMQRTDQWMVNYYELISEETARRKMLVDFHGAFKPSGLMRPYPNFITNEGVKGLEHAKWSTDITPEHTLILPFTRMLAGPMDFTPGAMNNAHERNFNILFERPMSMGTRCHQVAMYIVYESPLQMLCDNPSNYIKESETTKFISSIPTVWDETKVIDASVSDYIIIARKKDDTWYVGAITDGTARVFNIKLDFLSDGAFTAEIMKDGVNADRYASDYKHFFQKVNNQEELEINMASGGGWAAIIKKSE
ncbi:MAG: glycoside hydrolase family 97 protein [Melioribacteraceae bacterium]|nr:glycoside hydrolase family 97 protein [Melioribacteraceae bacterium]